MSREPDELEQHLAGLPAPAARAEFRRRLREQFVAGEGAGARATAARSRRPWYAAAAVLVIALGATLWFAMRPREGRWTVLEHGPGASVHVDGRPIASGAADELARRLAGARTLATTGARLRFALEDVARFELGAGSELLLESIPRAGASEEIVLELRSGALRVVTEGALAPLRLRVRAPDGEVLVVGTEFAVDLVPGMGTCICCTLGVIEVRSRHAAGEPQRVAAGSMALCPADGGMTKIGPVLPEHAAPLAELRAAVR